MILAVFPARLNLSIFEGRPSGLNRFPVSFNLKKWLPERKCDKIDRNYIIYYKSPAIMYFCSLVKSKHMLNQMVFIPVATKALLFIRKGFVIGVILVNTNFKSIFISRNVSVY